MIAIPKPIVKWVGGKRQLLPLLKELMPKEFNRYFEPFFGGGALFFSIQPSNAVINDFNPQLINMYNQIKNNPMKVMDILNEWQSKYNSLNSKEEKDAYYYQKRNEYNTHLISDTSDEVTAALLIFLNKSGFNGLYRINQGGLYNVPSGHKKRLNLFEENNILAVSQSLQNAEILPHGDFQKACQTAKEGDFVFFDSPYYDTFDSYQANGFSAHDHKRLCELFKSLSEKGVFCMLTNNDCDYIRNLYQGFNIRETNVKRLINRDAKHRTGKEIIITNNY